MVDRRLDRALCQQLADDLRARIRSGDLAPGSHLPSEATLAQTHRIGVPAVKHAIAVLRGEGLVTTQRGQPAVVRQNGNLEVVDLTVESVITARMPTPEERSELDLVDGVPVLVVHANGDQTVHAADATALRVRSSVTSRR